MSQHLQDLRAASHYPAIRAVVGIGVFLGYLVTIGMALAAFIGFGDSVVTGLIFLVGAAVTLLLTHAARELILMVADIADAVLGMSQSAKP